MTQIMNNTNKDKYKQLKELSYYRKEQGATELNSRLLTIRERKTLNTKMNNEIRTQITNVSLDIDKTNTYTKKKY